LPPPALTARGVRLRGVGYHPHPSPNPPPAATTTRRRQPHACRAPRPGITSRRHNRRTDHRHRLRPEARQAHPGKQTQERFIWAFLAGGGGGRVAPHEPPSPPQPLLSPSTPLHACVLPLPPRPACAGPPPAMRNAPRAHAFKARPYLSVVCDVLLWRCCTRDEERTRRKTLAAHPPAPPPRVCAGPLLPEASNSKPTQNQTTYVLLDRVT
jgi:hypothetical protein